MGIEPTQIALHAVTEGIPGLGCVRPMVARYPSAMTLQVQLVEDDYVEATRLCCRWKWIRSPALAVVVLLPLLIVLDAPTGVTVGAALGVLIAVPVVYFIAIPWRARKIFRQQVNLQYPFEIEWDEETISFSSKSGSFVAPWQEFRKWKENDSMLLLFHSDVLYQMIPKRAFANPAELETFRGIVAGKVSP